MEKNGKEILSQENEKNEKLIIKENNSDTTKTKE